MAAGGPEDVAGVGVPPEAERAMAARAGSTTGEIRSSHVPMISHPKAVLKLSHAAARA